MIAATVTPRWVRSRNRGSRLQVPGYGALAADTREEAQGRTRQVGARRPAYNRPPGARVALLRSPILPTGFAPHCLGVRSGSASGGAVPPTWRNWICSASPGGKCPCVSNQGSSASLRPQPGRRRAPSRSCQNGNREQSPPTPLYEAPPEKTDETAARRTIVRLEDGP
jgi:hypothetical protein